MKTVTVMGAALDSGNLGVGALATSMLEALSEYGSGVRVVVFDNGLGHREGVVQAGPRPITHESIGMRLSRRWYRPESLFQMKMSASLGLPSNAGVSAVKEATACLDISGGDSFTDMYGPHRFQAITQPKKLVIRLGTPLVLLPQTFGPYYAEDARVEAARILRDASSAWARDQRSYDVLCDLVGPDYDSTRHRRGVDIAFGLSPSEPEDSKHDDLRLWMVQPGPVAGINISGLLAGELSKGTVRDEINIDYRTAMISLIDRLLARSDARVLLVSHVLGKRPGSESDELAVASILAERGYDPARVRALPTDGLTAGQAKWWISKCDWFCGARMHSTIAGLSTGVPTAAVAYSIKTEPVFATVGQSAEVIDATTAQTEEVVDFLFERWTRRSETRESLSKCLPDLRRNLRQQMRTIVEEGLGARDRTSAAQGS